VADRAEFREQDLFATDLAKATVVTLYLLPEVNLQLRPSCRSSSPDAHRLPRLGHGRLEAGQTIEVDAPDKTIGREKKSRIHLWVVARRLSLGRGRLDHRAHLRDLVGREAALLGVLADESSFCAW
jgi:hypothetical protein